MADLLMAPQMMALPAASALTLAITPGDAAQAKAPHGTRADPKMRVSFADLLKSCNDKLPANGAKKPPAAADVAADTLPITDVDSATRPTAALTADPLVPLPLLSPTAPDSAAAATGDSAAIPEALSLADMNPSMDVLAVATQPSSPFSPPPSASPASPGPAAPDPLSPAGVARFMPLVPAPSPSGVAGAVSPGSTFAKRDAREERNSLDGQRSGLLPDTAFARNAPVDKLAAETAIPAETGKPGSLAAAAAAAGESAPDFRAAMERMTNHPAMAGMQPTGAAVATAQPPTVRVETPLGQPGWDQEVGDKLTWMAGNNRQQADLVLNPPQLGRIEVTMIVEGDKLSATFTSANIAVREALENSMARLREVLAEAGIRLGDTHVGAESRQDAKSFATRSDRYPSGNAGHESPVTLMDTIARGSTGSHQGGRGMVDVFA